MQHWCPGVFSSVFVEEDSVISVFVDVADVSVVQEGVAVVSRPVLVMLVTAASLILLQVLSACISTWCSPVEFSVRCQYSPKTYPQRHDS